MLLYAWGKALGRHKLAQHISPNQTVEGLVGGTGTAALLGAGLWWLTPHDPLQAAALSFGLCLAGVSGGLVRSAIKRDRRVKDWGRLIPGHGGVLDRMDSLCFSGPLLFYMLR